MPKERIKELFTISGDNAIFNALQAYTVPWQEDDIASSLDLLYMGHSGDKCIGPVVKMLVKDEAITSANFTALVKSIYDKYNKTWARLWDIYNAEYNAIENYDLIEHETIADTSSGTDTGSNSDKTETTQTGTVTDSGTTSETGSVTDNGTTSDTETIESNAESNATSEGTDDKGIYGFASTKQVSSDSNNTTADTSSTSTGTSTTTKSGTAGNEQTSTKSGTSSNEQSTSTTGTDTATGSYSKETTGQANRTRQLTRNGNIGIRSNQELIQQEIDLWKWNFFDTVFEDIDKVIALRVY